MRTFCEAVFFFGAVGTVLIKIAEAQVDGYYLRAYDVAAYQRL